MNRFLAKAKHQVRYVARAITNLRRGVLPKESPYAHHHRQSTGAKKAKPLLMRFPLQEQIIFLKRLSMILRAGMPILIGLTMLRDDARSRSTKHIFGHLVTTVEHGQPLSLGLGEFERELSAFSINIVRIGEASGTLHENLEYLADELKRKQALNRKIVGALIYPALIVVVTIGIATLLTVYIFPKILPIFSTIQATLPLSTRILISLSLFLSNWWAWLLLGLGAMVIGFIFLMRIPRCHYVADRILLSLPLFGTLSSYYNLTNINRTLSILLKSAVPILEAMDLVAASTRNLVYRQILLEGREKIMQGQKISTHFKDSPSYFPTIMTQMVAVGESTGNLSATLEFLSTLYEQEIDEYTKRLTNLLEPILMIIMGLIVGFIAISIITPIYGITEHLSDTR